LLDIALAGSVENAVLRAARKAFAARDQARAVELCTELVERDPNLLQAYLLRASSYLLTPKEPQQALADLDRLLQLAPPESHAAEAGHLLRAGLHFELKNYRETVADLSRAIEMGSKDPMVFMNRGLAHLRMKEYPAALPDLDRAVALAPKEAMVYNACVGFHMGMKNWAAARADLDKALELRPDYDLAILNMGSLAIQEGRLEEGCGWLRRAFKLSRRCLEHARSDEDLDSVRDRPEFKALMAEFEGGEPSGPQSGAGPCA
jgi:tetratricopeptide (TPR) repeat protein